MKKEVNIQTMEELLALVNSLEDDFIIHVESEVDADAKEEAEHR